MPFWSRRGASPRDVAWADFAAEYELAPASDLAERMREYFALGQGAIAPVYSLQRPDQPQIVLFDQRRDRSGPTGSVASLRTGVVIRSPHDYVPVSLRASARRHKVLEEIVARRAGGQRLGFDDETFDAQVSVFARDETAARSVLTLPVRSVLARLLAAADAVAPDTVPGPVPSAGVAPQVVIGARNLMLLVEPRTPLGFAPLGQLVTDMLTLYVAFTAAPRRVGGEPSDRLG
ncbi:MAG: hypothetical protein R6W77_07455 [Trueperaceae bacterium]